MGCRSYAANWHQCKKGDGHLDTTNGITGGHYHAGGSREGKSRSKTISYRPWCKAQPEFSF